MENNTLNAQMREQGGKGVARKLRAKGMIPGVFYLRNTENIPIQLDSHELQLLLKKKASILNLKLDNGTTHECVIRELQQDPISGRNIHIDLMGIIRGQNVTVQIPVELVGSAYGVRVQGGVLQHALHEINVECLPKHIPENITVDITELAIGDSIQIRDISVENVRILDDLERTIVSVLAPRIEKEVVEEEEEEEVEGEEAEGEAEEEAKPEGEAKEGGSE